MDVMSDLVDPVCRAIVRATFTLPRAVFFPHLISKTPADERNHRLGGVKQF